MKKYALVLPIFLSISGPPLYAQLYAPEIKIQSISDQNIGIGIPTPREKLHVNGAVFAGRAGKDSVSRHGLIYWNEKFLFSQQYLGDYTFGFYHGNSSDDYKPDGQREVFPYMSGYFGMDFFTEGARRMRITRNGKVGIGLTNPSTALEVNGDISLARTRKLVFLEKAGGGQRAYIRSTSGTNNEDFNSLVFSTDQESMVIKWDGRVGIGIKNPSHRLDVNGPVCSNGVALQSDERLKRDIQEYSAGLALVKKMSIKKYKYKPPKRKELVQDDNKEKLPKELDFYEQEQIGVLAQEIRQIAPQLVGKFVTNEKEEMLTVNHTALTYILINAVQELSTQVEEQQQLIEVLQKKK